MRWEIGKINAEEVLITKMWEEEDGKKFCCVLYKDGDVCFYIRYNDVNVTGVTYSIDRWIKGEI